MPVTKQILLIYAGTRGYLDPYPVSAIRRYEKDLLAFVDAKFPEVLEMIQQEQSLTPRVEAKIREVLDAFREKFSAEGA